MVPLLVNSSFSPPLKTFLLVKELWKAKPMSSILHVLNQFQNLEKISFLELTEY